MTPTEGATAMTTLERIEAALAHLAPDQQARDDWYELEHAIEQLGDWDGDLALAAAETMARIRGRRDAAYRELFAAKIELMGRGEGTSAS